MRILFSRNSPWSGVIRTSTHTLAEQFVQDGWDAIWLAHALTPWRALYGSHREALSLWRANGQQHVGLLEYCPLYLVAFGTAPLLRSSAVWRLGPFSAVPPLGPWLARRGFGDPDVLWLAHLSTAGLHRVVRPKVVVYHAHDAFTLYPGAPQGLRAIERDVVSRSDLVVCTSAATRRAMLEWYGAVDDRIIHVGHGVHLERYVGEVVAPSDIAMLPRPRVALVGTMALEDPALIAGTARLVPDASFVLIGPYSDRFAETIGSARLRNVALLGPRPQVSLPSYLRCCDAALIAYDAALRKTRLAGTDPMKRYEYAAAGLPTASVPLDEYDLSPSPMFIGHDAQSMAAAVCGALAADDDHRAALRRFAEGSSWSARYARVRAAIASIS